MRRKPDDRKIIFATAAIACLWFIGAFAFSAAHGPLASLVIAIGVVVGGFMGAAVSRESIDLGTVPTGFLLAAIFSFALVVDHSLVHVVMGGGLGMAIGLALVPLNAFLRTDPSWTIRAEAGVNLYCLAAAGAGWAISLQAGFPVLGFFALGTTACAAWQLPDITVRFILRTALASIMRVRVIGAENIPLTGPVLLVSNHISYADSVVMGSATPRIPRFLIWRPIYKTPVANFFFRVLHAIPIATESPKSTIQALRTARGELEKGEVVAIFPEGAITRSGEIEQFLRGFERIVDGLDVPIVPIHIDGLWGHPLSLKGGSLGGSWERAWWPVVTVRVGGPTYGRVSPADLREMVVGLAGQEAGYAIR